MNRSRAVAITTILLAVIVVSGIALAPYIFGPGSEADAISVTLLHTAGVMIEAEGMRIYVDPYNLSESYADFPADAILITHPHFDHYNETMVNMLQKDGTRNVFPAVMSEEIALHDGIGVVPGDSLNVGEINITVFYLYTETYGHARDRNWTSYLFDINGFVIYHGGDAKDMPELEQLRGLVDVAFIPAYLLGIGTVDAIMNLQPRYFIATHYTEGYLQSLIDTCEEEIAELAYTEPIWLEYWESHTFYP
ncbi:MAG: MBL fold metallo-hydrolase [Candidatus Thorarchaeota archaeon]|nr:MAG: MBL fold metallo-hydrolase [Candidatus Thorarchaeota archaeon]